jgi:hypothetical protein
MEFFKDYIPPGFVLDDEDNSVSAAADTLMGIFGFHRVRQTDTIHNKEGHMDPANANNLPEATQSDIIQEFDALVRSNSDTTTLAVKESLRGKGFWVNQRNVSDAIWGYVQNNLDTYTYEYQNGHRVYRYEPAQGIFGGGIPAGTLNTLSSSGPVSKSRKITPYKAKRVPSTGTWEVYAPDGNFALLLSETFTNTTRNKARYEYAKQHNVKYVDTIARKI